MPTLTKSEQDYLERLTRYYYYLAKANRDGVPSEEYNLAAFIIAYLEWEKKIQSKKVKRSSALQRELKKVVNKAQARLLKELDVKWYQKLAAFFQYGLNWRQKLIKKIAVEKDYIKYPSDNYKDIAKSLVTNSILKQLAKHDDNLRYQERIIEDNEAYIDTRFNVYPDDVERYLNDYHPFVDDLPDILTTVLPNELIESLPARCEKHAAKKLDQLSHFVLTEIIEIARASQKKSSNFFFKKQADETFSQYFAQLKREIPHQYEFLVNNLLQCDLKSRIGKGYYTQQLKQFIIHITGISKDQPMLKNRVAPIMALFALDENKINTLMQNSIMKLMLSVKKVLYDDETIKNGYQFDIVARYLKELEVVYNNHLIDYNDNFDVFLENLIAPIESASDIDYQKYRELTSQFMSALDKTTEQPALQKQLDHLLQSFWLSKNTIRIVLTEESESEFEL